MAGKSIIFCKPVLKEHLIIFLGDTVDGRNPKKKHLGCIGPCKIWDQLPTSTGDRQISSINSSTCNTEVAR